jgi:hypothetical protein
MPTISRFYGILIRMFFDDKHGPHFHVVYGEYQALVSIDDGALIAGDLPNRAYQLVLEWLALHRTELKANWENARKKKPLKAVAPLK